MIANKSNSVANFKTISPDHPFIFAKLVPKTLNIKGDPYRSHKIFLLYIREDDNVLINVFFNEHWKCFSRNLIVHFIMKNILLEFRILSVVNEMHDLGINSPKVLNRNIKSHMI